MKALKIVIEQNTEALEIKIVLPSLTSSETYHSTHVGIQETNTGFKNTIEVNDYEMKKIFTDRGVEIITSIINDSIYNLNYFEKCSEVNELSNKINDLSLFIGDGGDDLKDTLSNSVKLLNTAMNLTAHHPTLYPE